MKLYELTEAYANIQYLIEEVESDEALKVLDEIDQDIEEKAESIAKVLKNLEAEADAYKEESKRLGDKAKAAENKAASLKAYLESHIKATGKKKFKKGVFTFSIQKNPPRAVVEDEAAIDKLYFIEQAPKLDKKSLLKDLKDGKEVKGAHLEQSESLRIR